MESHEIETLVGELETRVDRLRALYEQYFMGIERMAPSVPHKDVDRRIQVLRKEQIRNTAVRFRFQMIIQRYNTYQTHWQRICRQIEEGTYKRDILRAQRKFKPAAVEPESVPPPQPEPEPAPAPAPMPPEPPTKKIEKLELDDFAELDRVLADPGPQKAPAPAPAPAVAKPAAPAAPRPMWRKVGDLKAPAAAPAPVPAPAAQAAQPLPVPKKPPPPLPVKPAAPPAPAAVAKPAPPPAPAPKPAPPAPSPAAARSPADLSDDRLRQIYSQYVQTRRAQNESTAAITYDAMAKSLRESSAKLREKHGKQVDFEVTVKDGKTVLRPVVKPK